MDAEGLLGNAIGDDFAVGDGDQGRVGVEVDSSVPEVIDTDGEIAAIALFVERIERFWGGAQEGITGGCGAELGTLDKQIDDGAGAIGCGFIGEFVFNGTLDAGIGFD